MNYHKQCWSCGSKDMESKGDYSQCSDCGATHNDLPSGGVLPVLVVSAKTGRKPRVDEATEYRPHAVIARQAKRARERRSEKKDIP